MIREITVHCFHFFFTLMIFCKFLSELQCLKYFCHRCAASIMLIFVFTGGNVGKSTLRAKDFNPMFQMP